MRQTLGGGYICSHPNNKYECGEPARWVSDEEGAPHWNGEAWCDKHKPRDSGTELTEQLRASVEMVEARKGTAPPASEVRIVDPVTGGAKGQKPERYDLLPFDALDEVARVYHYGAQKYEPNNWLRGYAWSLSLGALLRHVARFACREDVDPDTGCHHLAHAAFHCLSLIAFGRRKLGTDDRMVKP